MCRARDVVPDKSPYRMWLDPDCRIPTNPRIAASLGPSRTNRLANQQCRSASSGAMNFCGRPPHTLPCRGCLLATPTGASPHSPPAAGVIADPTVMTQQLQFYKLSILNGTVSSTVLVAMTPAAGGLWGRTSSCGPGRQPLHGRSVGRPSAKFIPRKDADPHADGQNRFVRLGQVKQRFSDCGIRPIRIAGHIPIKATCRAQRHGRAHAPRTGRAHHRSS